MPLNIRRVYALRVISYILLVIFALALQNALPTIYHVRPLLLIMLTALAAMFQGPHTGGITGFFCGLLADWLSVYSVVYYTVALMLLGALLGRLVDYGIRKTIFSAYFVTIITLAVTQFIYFVFFLFIPRRAGVHVLVDITTPEILYSLALLPIFYFPVRTVYRRTRLKKG